jgi:hypothetical protein
VPALALDRPQGYGDAVLHHDHVLGAGSGRSERREHERSAYVGPRAREIFVPDVERKRELLAHDEGHASAQRRFELAARAIVGTVPPYVRTDAEPGLPATRELGANLGPPIGRKSSQRSLPLPEGP